MVETLHDAINENECDQVYEILSKNRPFENVLKKHMSKVIFGDSFAGPASSFILLQVDEKVAQAVESGEESLSIRGDLADDTVLCTMTATYPIKMIESSTSYLLMNNPISQPDEKDGGEGDQEFAVDTIRGKCFAVAELCPPVDILDIGRLKDLLHQSQLMWEDDPTIMKDKGVTMKELLNKVQMSRGEIEAALADLPVIRYDSKLYYLSHNYRAELIGTLVDLLDEESEELSLENVSEEALRRSFFVGAIDWILGNLCEPSGSGSGFRIDRRRFVRAMIVTILNSVQKMPLKQFVDVLKKILPDGIEFERSDIDGICDISDTPNGKVVVYLSPEDLPDKIQDRMRYLFEQRRKWSMDALRPFFQDLIKDKVAFDKFVVQNCEYTVSDDNQMYYCGLKMGV